MPFDKPKKPKDRSPVSEPLRRLPGQSLREEISDVVDNNLAAAVVAITCSGKKGDMLRSLRLVPA